MPDDTELAQGEVPSTKLHLKLGCKGRSQLAQSSVKFPSFLPVQMCFADNSSSVLQQTLKEQKKKKSASSRVGLRWKI